MICGCGNPMGNSSRMCMGCATTCECGGKKDKNKDKCSVCNLKCECGRQKSYTSKKCDYCKENPPDCPNCDKKVPYRRALNGYKFCSASCYENVLSSPIDEYKQVPRRPEREYSDKSDDEDLWVWIEEAEKEAEIAEIAGKSFSVYTCVYCSEPSDCRDHLLPRAWTGEVYRHYVPTVEACDGCNQILGGSFLPSIWRRAHFVAEYLHRKHREFLAASWTDNELRSLGHSLFGTIRDAEKKRRVLLNRLRVLEAGGIPGVLGLSDCPEFGQEYQDKSTERLS